MGEATESAIERSQNQASAGVMQLHSMIGDSLLEKHSSVIRKTAALDSRCRTSGDYLSPSSLEHGPRHSHWAPVMQRNRLAINFAEFRPKARAFWALRTAILFAAEERRYQALCEK